MESIKELIEVVETTTPYILLVVMIIVSVVFLARYIKQTQAQTRIDIKEIHKNYRSDIIELMNRCKEERTEQRLSLEKMSESNNKVMTRLTMAVAELKIVVDSNIRK